MWMENCVDSNEASWSGSTQFSKKGIEIEKAMHTLSLLGIQ